jgi:hypothetical protein
MKYIVELKYTNPSHEHVSLRRRVDTVSRVVEAASEDEALNRAANQQRALGFRIQEAKVINEEQRTTTFPVGGGVVNLPKNLPSEKDGTAKVYDADKDEKKLSPKGGFAVKKEEVEQMDEMDKSQPSSSRGAEGLATGTKATPVTSKKAAADALKLLKKKVKPVKEEVGADKRDAGYKMSSTVAAAQKKFDAQSKGQGKMRPQAGTLAAVHKSMERDMKKEAADPGSMRVVNKKVRAADKMVGAAKKAAVVNLEPELKITRPMI